MAKKPSTGRSASSGRFAKIVKKAARTIVKAAGKKGKPGNPGHTTKK